MSVKNDNVSKTVSIWPGTAVSGSEILQYLDAVLIPERLNGHQHYVFSPRSSKIFNRSADILCTNRLCWMEVPRPIQVEAYFDGAWNTRKIYNGDIFVGGYNGFNRTLDAANSVYKGFSIIFHLHHIRLHYGSFDCGRELVNVYYHTPHPASGTLELLRKALDSIIHETGEARAERCRGIIEAILQQLRHEMVTQENPGYSKNPLALRIKNYLEHNFSHPIDCSSVSEALEINRSYASTLFRSEFNMTMQDYLTMLRLESAEVLLSSEEDLKVEDVAHFCAFASASYFVKVFRKYYGMTPKEYRRKQSLQH